MHRQLAIAALLAGLAPAPGVVAGDAERIEIRNYSADPPRDYVGEIRNIEGLQAGIGGNAKGLVAEVTELEKAVKDLGAEVRAQEIHLDLSADVLFDFDKWNIKPAAESELQKVVLIIREKRKGDVWIHGHTDAKGSDSYNQKLSEQRAESVMYWLAVNGDIPMDVLKTQGHGESLPVAPNSHADGSDNPEGRRKNRRVEIVIKTVENAS